MYVLPTFWNLDLMMLGAVSQTSLSAVSLAGRVQIIWKKMFVPADRLLTKDFWQRLP